MFLMDIGKRYDIYPLTHLKHTLICMDMSCLSMHQCLCVYKMKEVSMLL